MRKSTPLRTVAFALLASLLLLTAMPAAASSHNPSVASEHTTAADFTDAEQLTNVSVTGSGDAASVTLAGYDYYDGFDDEPADAGLPNGWSSAGSSINPEVTTSTSYDGTQSFTAEDNSGTLSDANFGTVTANASAAIRGTSSSATAVYLQESNDNNVHVAMRNGDLQYNDGSWNTISTSPDAGEWVYVTIYDIDPSTDTYSLRWETPTDSGTATGLGMRSAMSSGYDQIQLGEFGDRGYWDAISVGDSSGTGTYVSQTHDASSVSDGWTNLSLTNANASIEWTADTDGDGTFETTAASATYTSSGNRTLDVSSVDADAWRVRVEFASTGSNPSAALHDEGLLFQARDPQGSNLQPDSATINDDDVQLSVDISDADFGTPQGDAVTAEFRVDGSIVDTATATSNGSVTGTASNLPDGTHTWNVTLTDDYGGTTTTADATFTTSHFDPQFNDSSADPTGDQTTDPGSLSVEVTDRDFTGDDDGDTVAVEFFLDGSSVGSDTLTSNGTASVPVSASGGDHTWHAVATDDYGGSTNSSTDGTPSRYQFAVPSDLEIRKEETPSELVDNATVALEFYFEGTSGPDQIVVRETSDGTIDMSGLPTDQPFVVVADADGYFPRRIFVESLYEAQEIFLLNDSSPSREVTFNLEDFTGDYPEEDTVLQVQRNINSSWKTVQGDYFGATGEVPAQLSYNTRHRLIIMNTETGDTRNVGTYTPTTGGEQTIRVLRSRTTLEEAGPVFNTRPSTRTLSATNDSSVTVELDANSAQIDSWGVNVSLRNDSGTFTLYQRTFSGPNGSTVSPTFNLSGQQGATVLVVTNATTGGETIGKRAEFRVSEYFGHSNSLWAVLTGAPAVLGLGSGAMTFIAVVLSVIGTAALAAFAPVSTEMVGTVAVAFATIFAAIGFLPWRVVFAAGVTFVALWGLWRGL